MRAAGLWAILLAGLVATSTATAAPADADSAAGAALARVPKPRPLLERCVTRAERRRVVRFKALDRVQLVGLELGGGPRAVILAHQGGGGDGQFLCAWMPYGRALVAQGYRVLVFDHRGFGSSGQASNFSRRRRVDFDVLAAIGFLRSRGATSIVLAGASLGGAAVLAAAVHARPAVNGVISFASPLTFGTISALNAARALTVPVLFLSAVDDGSFAEEARRMYEACSSPDRRLEIVPGDRHGAPVLRDAGTRQLVDAWIRAHLP
jgi:alpha-beta hydrolase superfamily lysophospholipase